MINNVYDTIAFVLAGISFVGPPVITVLSVILLWYRIRLRRRELKKNP